MDFPARLRSLRAEKNLSQEELSKEVGMSLSGYKKVERGESSPTLANLLALSNFYDVSLDYLTGKSESRKR